MTNTKFKTGFIWEEEKENEKEKHTGLFQCVCFMLGGRYVDVDYIFPAFYMLKLFHNMKEKAFIFSR